MRNNGVNRMRRNRGYRYNLWQRCIAFLMSIIMVLSIDLSNFAIAFAADGDDSTDLKVNGASMQFSGTDYTTVPRATYGDALDFTLDGSTGLNVYYVLHTSIMHDDDHNIIISDENLYTSDKHLTPGNYAIFYNDDKGESMGAGSCVDSDDHSACIHGMPEYGLVITEATFSGVANLSLVDGVANWDAATKSTTGSDIVSGTAVNYSVSLYDNSDNLVKTYNNVSAVTQDFTSDITAHGYGDYHFTVTVEGTDYYYASTAVSSKDSASGVYTYKDTVKPVVDGYVADKKDNTFVLKGQAHDEGIGLESYAFALSSVAEADISWTEVADEYKVPSTSFEITYAPLAEGDYYFYVKDAHGNIQKSGASVSVTEVKFNDYYENDTATDKSVFITGNQEYTLPTIVGKTGYIFKGWYKEAAHTNKVTTVVPGTDPVSGSSYDVYAWLEKQSFSLSISESTNTFNKKYDGEDLNLSVAMPDGVTYKSIAYEWYVKKAGEDNFSLISGATTSSITVKECGDSGTYYVKVILTLAGDEKQEVASGEQTVTIQKREVNVKPSDITINYMDNAPAYTFAIDETAGGDALVTGDTLASLLSAYIDRLECSYKSGDPAGTYTITYSGEDIEADNYVFKVDDKTGTLSVEGMVVADNDDITVALEGYTFDYTGSEIKPAVTVKRKLGDGTSIDLTAGEDFDVAYSGNVTAGNNTAVVTVSFKGNYQGTRELKFSINKINSYTATVKMDDWKFGDTASTPAIVEGVRDGAVPVYYYKSKTAGAFSTDGGTTTKPVNAGDYYVWAYIPATANYDAFYTAPTEFTINKRTIVITAASNSWEYDGNAHTAATYTETGDGFYSEDGFKWVSVVGTITDKNEEGVPNVITYELTSTTLASNYDIKAVNGTLKVTGRTLVNPTIFGWDAKKAGKVSWVAITRDSFTPSYRIKLYRVSGGNYTLIDTQETTSTSVDFLDKMHSDSEINGASGYAVTIQVLSDNANYIASDESEKSVVKYTAKLNVEVGEGCDSAVIDGDKSTVIIFQGETLKLFLVRSHGYTTKYPSWVVEAPNSGLFTIYYNFSNYAEIKLNNDGVTGPVNAVVEASSADDTPWIENINIALTADKSEALLSFDVRDHLNVNSYAVMKGKGNQPGDSDWIAIPQTDVQGHINSYYDYKVQNYELTEEGEYYIYCKDNAGNVAERPVPVLYAITFDPNFGDGTGTGSEYKILKIADESIALPANTFHKDGGYAFTNWSGTTGVYADGGDYVSNASDTLKAQWTNRQYSYKVKYYYMTLKVDGDGKPVLDGEGKYQYEYVEDIDAQASLKGVYGATISYNDAAIQIKKTGYTLTGTPTGIESYAQSFTLTEDYREKTADQDEASVIRLYYDLNQHTITYNYKYADGTTPAGSWPVVKEYRYNDPVVELEKPVATGYTFVGWNYGDAGQAPETMPDNNLNVTGEMQANAGIYKIFYYKQNLDQSNYNEAIKDTDRLYRAYTFALDGDLTETINSTHNTNISFDIADAKKLDGFEVRAVVVTTDGQGAGSQEFATWEDFEAWVSAGNTENDAVSGVVDAETNGLCISIYYIRKAYTLNLNVWKDAREKGHNLYTNSWTFPYGYVFANEDATDTAGRVEGDSTVTDDATKSFKASHFETYERSKWLDNWSAVAGEDAVEDYMLAEFKDWSTGSRPVTMPAGDVSIAREYVSNVVQPYKVKIYFETLASKTDELGNTIYYPDGSYIEKTSYERYGRAGSAVKIVDTVPADADKAADTIYVTFDELVKSIDYNSRYEHNPANDLRFSDECLEGAITKKAEDGTGELELSVHFVRKEYTSYVRYYSTEAGEEKETLLAYTSHKGKWGTTYYVDPLYYFDGTTTAPGAKDAVSSKDIKKNNGAGFTTVNATTSDAISDTTTGILKSERLKNFKNEKFIASYSGYYWIANNAAGNSTYTYSYPNNQYTANGTVYDTNKAVNINNAHMLTMTIGSSGSHANDSASYSSPVSYMNVYYTAQTRDLHYYVVPQYEIKNTGSNSNPLTIKLKDSDVASGTVNIKMDCKSTDATLSAEATAAGYNMIAGDRSEEAGYTVYSIRVANKADIFVNYGFESSSGDYTDYPGLGVYEGQYKYTNESNTTQKVREKDGNPLFKEVTIKTSYEWKIDTPESSGTAGGTDKYYIDEANKVIYVLANNDSPFYYGNRTNMSYNGLANNQAKLGYDMFICKNNQPDTDQYKVYQRINGHSILRYEGAVDPIFAPTGTGSIGSAGYAVNSYYYDTENDLYITYTFDGKQASSGPYDYNAHINKSDIKHSSFSVEDGYMIVWYKESTFENQADAFIIQKHTYFYGRKENMPIENKDYVYYQLPESKTIGVKTYDTYITKSDIADISWTDRTGGSITGTGCEMLVSSVTSTYVNKFNTSINIDGFKTEYYVDGLLVMSINPNYSMSYNEFTMDYGKYARAGFEFDAKNTQNKLKAFATITPQELYAYYERGQYTLTVTKNNSKVNNDDVTLLNSGTRIELADPEKEGYIFDGWKIVKVVGENETELTSDEISAISYKWDKSGKSTVFFMPHHDAKAVAVWKADTVSHTVLYYFQNNKKVYNPDLLETIQGYVPLDPGATELPHRESIEVVNKSGGTLSAIAYVDGSDVKAVSVVDGDMTYYYTGMVLSPDSKYVIEDSKLFAAIRTVAITSEDVKSVDAYKIDTDKFGGMFEYAYTVYQWDVINDVLPKVDAEQHVIDTFTVYPDMTLSYYYQRDSHKNIKVTKLSTDGGASGLNVTGDGQHYYGEDVTLHASLEHGYTFNGWYLESEVYKDGVLDITDKTPLSTDLSYTFNVTGAVNMVAVTTPNTVKKPVTTVNSTRDVVEEPYIYGYDASAHNALKNSINWGEGGAGDSYIKKYNWYRIYYAPGTEPECVTNNTTTENIATEDMEDVGNNASTLLFPSGQAAGKYVYRCVTTIARKDNEREEIVYNDYILTVEQTDEYISFYDESYDYDGAKHTVVYSVYSTIKDGAYEIYYSEEELNPENIESMITSGKAGTEILKYADVNVTNKDDDSADTHDVIPHNIYYYVKSKDTNCKDKYGVAKLTINPVMLSVSYSKAFVKTYDGTATVQGSFDDTESDFYKLATGECYKLDGILDYDKAIHHYIDFSAAFDTKDTNATSVTLSNMWLMDQDALNRFVRNYNYRFPNGESLPISGQIKPYPLEIEWEDDTTEFIYDGSVHKPSIEIKDGGPDNLTTSDVVVTNGQINAGTYMAGAEVQSSDRYNSSDYTFTVTSKQYTISPRYLQVSPKDATKVFNGGTQTCDELVFMTKNKATDPWTSYNTNSLPTGETCIVTTTNGGPDVGEYTISLNTGLKILDSNNKNIVDNYIISTTTGKLTIVPCPVAVQGISAENKDYDGTNSATLNVDSATFKVLKTDESCNVVIDGSGKAEVLKDGLYNSDALKVDIAKVSGLFTDELAGTGKTVNIAYDMSTANSDQTGGVLADVTGKTCAKNYYLVPEHSQKVATADIGKNTVLKVSLTNASSVYGEIPDNYGLTFTGFKKVGEDSSLVSGSDSVTYIIKKIGEAGAADETVVADGKSDAIKSLPAGTYHIYLKTNDNSKIATGLSADNYTIEWDEVPATLVVAKRPISVAAVASASITKDYDGTTDVTEATSTIQTKYAFGTTSDDKSGVVNSDAVSLKSYTAIYDSKDVSATKVTFASLVLDDASAANYELKTSSFDMDGKINPISLTITIKDMEITYGDAIASYEYEVVGAIESESASILAAVESKTVPDCVYTNVAGSDNRHAGKYAITVDTSSSDKSYKNANYSITYATKTLSDGTTPANAILKVNKAELHYVVDDINIVYAKDAIPTTFTGALKAEDWKYGESLGNGVAFTKTDSTKISTVAELNSYTIYQLNNGIAVEKDITPAGDYVIKATNIEALTADDYVIIPVEGTLNIAKYYVQIDGVWIVGKIYDGTTDVADSHIKTDEVVFTFYGGDTKAGAPVKSGDSKFAEMLGSINISAKYQSADAGNNKPIDVTITLKEGGYLDQRYILLTDTTKSEAKKIVGSGITDATEVTQTEGKAYIIGEDGKKGGETTIGKRPLEIYPGDATIKYGEDITVAISKPSGATGKYSLIDYTKPTGAEKIGFVSGEDFATIGFDLVSEIKSETLGTYAAGSDVGVYTINIGTSSASKANNYDITYKTGKLTVEQSKLSTPEPLWDSANPGTVKWTAVPKIGKVSVKDYRVQLYKDGAVQTTYEASVNAKDSDTVLTYDFASAIKTLGSGAYTVKVTAEAKTENNDTYKNVAQYSETGVTADPVYAAKVIVKYDTDTDTTAAKSDATSYSKVGTAEDRSDNLIVIAGESDIPYEYFWKNTAGYSSGYSVKKCEASSDKLTIVADSTDNSKLGKYSGKLSLASSLSSNADITVTLTLEPRVAEIKSLKVNEQSGIKSLMYSYSEEQAPVYETVIVHNDSDVAYDYTYEWKYSRGLGKTKIDGGTDATYKLYTTPILTQYSSYYVYCTVTATRKDNGKSTSKDANTTFTVARAKPGADSVLIKLNGTDISGISNPGWKYGESRGSFTAEGKFEGLGAVTLYYASGNTDSASWSTDVPTNAGTYYVKFSVAQSDNYDAYDLPSASAKPFTITSNKLDGATGLTMVGSSSVPYGKAQWNKVTGPKENGGATPSASAVEATYEVALYYSEDNTTYTLIKTYAESDVTIGASECSLDMINDMKKDGFYYYTVKAISNCKYTDNSAAPKANCDDSDIVESAKFHVISKLDITGADQVEADKVSKVYSGDAITMAVTEGEGYTYQWYKDNSPISGATSASIALTYVEDSGVYVCKITSGGNDFYSAYEKVEITPRSLTIKSYSLTKTYDGTPLAATDATMQAAGMGSSTEIFTPAAMSGKTGIVVNKSGDKVVAKDTVTSITQSASITTAGSVTNTMTGIVITRSLYDESGAVVGTKEVYKEGATHNNYVITLDEGTLKVEKGAITVTAKSDSKVYDGTPLTNAGFDVVGIPATSSDIATATITGTITEAGEVANVVGSVEVKAGGSDVTSSYVVTKVNGKLTIERKSIGTGTTEGTDFTISGIPVSVEYNASAWTPTVSVVDSGRKDGNTTLALGTDYQVQYTNNVKAGTATVTITGIGNYTGSVTKTFAITAAPLKEIQLKNTEYEYVLANSHTAGGETSKVIATHNGSTDIELATSDYTLKLYKVTGAGDEEVTSANQVGVYKVVATGIGNYTGNVSKTFAIKDSFDPVITGVVSGKNYCNPVAVNISDNSLVSVIVTKDGEPFINRDYSANVPYKTSDVVNLTGDENGNVYVITAMDASGNSKTVTVKVFEDHKFTIYTPHNGGTKVANCDHDCGATNTVVTRWGRVDWDYNYSYTNENGGTDTGVQGVDARATGARVELIQNGVVIATRIVDCESQCGTSADPVGDTGSVAYSFEAYNPSDATADQAACTVLIPEKDSHGHLYSYDVRVTPISTHGTSVHDYMVTDVDRNYDVGAAGYEAKITYAPGQFMVRWHITLKGVPEDLAPDKLYAKVLFAYSANADNSETNTGYQIISQQVANHGTECIKVIGADGEYYYEGGYPVWEYQGNTRESYYHRIQVTGYELNGTFHDVTSEGYKSPNTPDHVNHTIYYDGNEASGVIKYELVGIKIDTPLVIFDYNADNATGTVTYYYMDNGDPVTEAMLNAAIPSRAGYNFTGWYTAVSGGTKVSSIDSLTESITLYAHWSEIVIEPDDDPDDIRPVPTVTPIPTAAPTPTKAPANNGTKNPKDGDKDTPDKPDDKKPSNEGGDGDETRVTIDDTENDKPDDAINKILDDILEKILNKELEDFTPEDGNEYDVKLVTIINLTLEEKKGDEDWAKKKASGKPIRVTIDIPEDAINEGGTIYLIKKDGDGYIILKDLDDDPNTITIETTDFDSAYALISIIDNGIPLFSGLEGDASDEGENPPGKVPELEDVCYWHYIIFVTDLIYVVLIILTARRKKRDDEDGEDDEKTNNDEKYERDKKERQDKSKDRRVFGQIVLAAVFIVCNILGHCKVELPASLISYVVVSVMNALGYQHKFSEKKDKENQK